MRHVLLLPIALIFFTISSPATNACQCRKPLPVCAQYWSSDVVFVGQLREITPPNTPSTTSLPIATLHFIVEESFRGVTTPTIDVGVLSGTSCDSRFGKGTRYLIYASRDPKTNQLFAGPCGRTNTAEHAADDLNYLRLVNTQGVPESLQGQVGSSVNQPRSGVRIQVRQSDKTLETTTDDGYYQLTLPGPGTYAVKVLVPTAVTVLATRDDLLRNIKTTIKMSSEEPLANPLILSDLQVGEKCPVKGGKPF